MSMSSVRDSFERRKAEAFLSADATRGGTVFLLYRWLSIRVDRAQRIVSSMLRLIVLHEDVTTEAKQLLGGRIEDHAYIGVSFSRVELLHSLIILRASEVVIPLNASR